MKKYNLTYQRAFERAKSKRNLVHPNNGFAMQCKLFYKMSYTIDPQNKYYKVFRLKLAAEKVKSAKILPYNFMDLIRPDPGVSQEYPESYVYRCRKCRRVVASKSNLILHKIPQDPFESPSSRRKNKAETAQKYLNSLASDDQDQDAIIDITDKVLTASLSDKSLSEIDKVDTSTAQEFCNKIYFVEPIAWMKEVINNVEGKLHCPTCRTKIGSFNWVMASKCPCGVQVAPSFYLVPSKIDFSNIIQNAQVTI
jgi:dual specificity phosphatase 12